MVAWNPATSSTRFRELRWLARKSIRAQNPPRDNKAQNHQEELTPSPTPASSFLSFSPIFSTRMCVCRHGQRVLYCLCAARIAHIFVVFVVVQIASSWCCCGVWSDQWVGRPFYIHIDMNEPPSSPMTREEIIVNKSTSGERWDDKHSLRQRGREVRRRRGSGGGRTLSKQNRRPSLLLLHISFLRMCAQHDEYVLHNFVLSFYFEKLM